MLVTLDTSVNWGSPCYSYGPVRHSLEASMSCARSQHRLCCWIVSTAWVSWLLWA